MDGFTLTGLAFPVAPANLSGFTIQGYQWVAVSGSTPITFGSVFQRAMWSWMNVFPREIATWARLFGNSPSIWARSWRWSVANSMPVTSLTKPESEDRDFGFDFSQSPEIQGGATISSAAVLSPPVGLTFGAVRVNEAFDGIASGKIAVVEISGGTDENTYAFAVKATLSTGRMLVIPARLVVTGDAD